MNETDGVLDGYVVGLPPEREALVRRLHAAIATAHPGFDVAIKYGLLMYAIGGDWRHWVVSVDAHPKGGVGLRFLFGVLMADERHVLRRGSSVLMTWDLDPAAELDVGVVGSYVEEAVRLYPAYKADQKTILALARASVPARPGHPARSARGGLG
jgi:hypothetical protein